MKDVEWTFKGWMFLCLLAAAVLGIHYYLGFQDYRADVEALFETHRTALEGIEDTAEAEQYIMFVAPELIQKRDFLRAEYWLYLGFSVLGVPKPTKKTLKKAYIALKERVNRGET